MSDQKQHRAGGTLPPLQNQRVLQGGVTDKDKVQLLQDFSVAEDRDQLYQSLSDQRIDQQRTGFKERLESGNRTLQGSQQDLPTRDAGGKLHNSEIGELVNLINPGRSLHQGTTLKADGAHQICHFVAPPGSLDELMMAKVRKENIQLEDEVRMKAGKKSKWSKVAGLLEDQEDDELSFAKVATKVMEGQGNKIQSSTGLEANQSENYDSSQKNLRGVDSRKNRLHPGTSDDQVNDIAPLNNDGPKWGPLSSIKNQKQQYKILPGLNADKTNFKPEILDDIYEPHNKFSVDDCWINRDQDVMIIFNWSNELLHQVEIKHNGVRILNKTKKFDKKLFEQMNVQGNRQGFNFRISNNLDYLLIRYQNIIATAHIQSLEQLFESDFKLEEQLLKTCKTIVQSDKEKKTRVEGVDPVQLQIASAVIDNEDHLIFAARRDTGQKKDLVIFHSNDKIEKIHEHLLNGLGKNDELFSLHSLKSGTPTFQDFPFLPESIGHSNLDVYFQHQRGCQFLFVVENQSLTKVYKPSKDDRSLISVHHKSDIFRSNQLFYRTKDDSLFIKTEQMILQYKYEGKILHGGVTEKSYKEMKRIVKTKKELPSDSQLMKVYDRFVYTIKESDITIIDFDNEKVLTTVKIVGVINQPMYQLQNSPTIVDKSGFHNVFYPEPLLTHHSTHVDSSQKLEINDYSSGIQITEEIVRRHATRFMRENCPSFLSGQAEMKLVDYIPEEFLVVIAKQKKKKGEAIAISDGVLVKKLNAPDLTIDRPNLKFGDLVYRGFLSEVRDNQTPAKDVNVKPTVFYITYLIEADPKDPQIHIHSFNVLYIPLGNIAMANQQELFRLEINQENSHLPIDKILYCWKRSELFINYMPSNDIQYSELVQLNIFEGKIAVQTRNKLQNYVDKPIFYTDRLLYYYENISNALEVKKMKKDMDGFRLEGNPIKSYQSIINVIQIYRLYNIVLIHTGDDSLYLTDVDCYTIKAQITGLFNGVTSQDRSERNHIFVKNYYRKQVFSLNLFNNSPNSLPYQLLMKKGLFSQYDHNTRFIKFFRSVEQTSEVDIVSQIKVRSFSNPYMDLQKKSEKNKDRWWDMRVFIYPYLDILKKMKKMNIFDLLSYNLINRKHFIYEAVMFDDILKKLIQLIEDLPETEHKPYIFPEVLNRDQALLLAWQQQHAHDDDDKQYVEVSPSHKLPVMGSSSEVKQDIQKYLVGAFDLAIDLKERLIIQNLLNLMIISDQHGCLYSDLVAQNIKNFITYKISLKEYFSSSMPIVVHDQLDYPQFHNLDNSLYLALNPTEHQTVNDIKTDDFYDKFMQPSLDDIQQWEDLNWFNQYLNPVRPIANYLTKKIRKCKRKQNKNLNQVFEAHNNLNQTQQKAQPAGNMSSQKIDIMAKSGSVKDQTGGSSSKPNEMKFDKDKELYEIEYSLVNMPELLSGDMETCLSFMKLIQSEGDKDISFLEIPVIQNVINFKWQTYTEKFFIRQFIKTFLFILTFIIEIILTSPFGLDEEEEDGRNAKIAHIITRVFCAIMMLDHFRYEVRQLKSDNAEQYFTKDYWNIFDVIMFVLYMAYIPISFIYDNESYIVKIIQCSILLLFQIKFNFYLRIFDKFGFLVQMIVTVFYDLKYFLVYYLIIISFFSIQVSIIMKDVEDHDGIGPLMFFVMTLRTSLGDNDIDQQFSEYKILFWIVWFLIMVVGNIVLMNFIIAVVSQSYDNCMQKQVAQTFKTKVDMIVEREQMMSEKEFNKKKRKYFPQLILVRKIMDREAIQAREDESRMEMLTKEVRRISLSVQEIKTEQRTKTIDEIKEMKEMLHKIAIKMDQPKLSA